MSDDSTERFVAELRQEADATHVAHLTDPAVAAGTRHSPWLRLRTRTAALAASIYLSVLSRIDNILFSGESLIRRHEVFDRQALQSLRRQDAWRGARLIRGTEGDAGFTVNLEDIKAKQAGPSWQAATVKSGSAARRVSPHWRAL